MRVSRLEKDSRNICYCNLDNGECKKTFTCRIDSELDDKLIQYIINPD